MASNVTKADGSGYWLVTTSVLGKTSWIPNDIHSTDKITYDNDTHRWVDVYTDDTGGYDVTTSPGWTGNTMVWTDRLFTPTNDVSAQSPTTVTKVSDTKTTSHSTFKETKSGRTITFDVVCTKG